MQHSGQQKAARHDWKLLQAWRRDASLQADFLHIAAIPFFH